MIEWTFTEDILNTLIMLLASAFTLCGCRLMTQSIDRKCEEYDNPNENQMSSLGASFNTWRYGLGFVILLVGLGVTVAMLIASHR